MSEILDWGLTLLALVVAIALIVLSFAQTIVR
jgi:hypothetical protein